MRSDPDERVNIKVTMGEKSVGWILRDLAGDKQAKKESDAMDVDERKPEVPKTATLVPGSTVQLKRTVDLESKAFSQGCHLMSNKKCRLPEGSFKRSKKGYEKIHIPAPKSKPVTDAELVPIINTVIESWGSQHRYIGIVSYGQEPDIGVKLSLLNVAGM